MAEAQAVVAAPLDMAPQLEALRAALPAWPDELAGALARAFQSGAGEQHWFMVAASMLAAGVLVELAGNVKLGQISRQVAPRQGEDFAARGFLALVRAVFGLVGLALFWAGGALALAVMTTSGSALAQSLEVVLGAVVDVRAIMIVVRAIFAPRQPPLRLLPLSDADARAFHRWLFVFSAYYSAVVAFGGVLQVGELPQVLFRATYVVTSGSVALVFIVFIVASRERIARQFVDESRPVGRVGQLLGRTWPALAVVWMLALNVNWTRAVFVHDQARIDALLIAWWVTLLFPLADRLFHVALQAILERPVVLDSPFASRAGRFSHVLQTWFRALLVLVALFALAVAWEVAGVALLRDAVGRQVLHSVLNVGVTLLVAYVVFEVGVAFLDQKMPVPAAVAEAADGEGGGAGATRAETLAPLVRGTFIVVLTAVVILTVLSSLGIEVAPLLAGAGVFGIAIGFGAQKLVQDIISGFFFLLDDAFRRGEYIDVGTVKGTVEKISIRSMQLRHHMGNLHTIPFGEIRYLTNFSRDWVMMKLKLRLAYGTDPEQVRKLVKKLGQELLAHPEVGEKFMEPLKSQGVFSLEDDSAMIFRVKFMTRPGDQFVVRKAVYTALHECFDRAGIEFAHRVVTVRVEDGADADPDAGRADRLAGAVLPVVADRADAPDRA